MKKQDLKEAIKAVMLGESIFGTADADIKERDMILKSLHTLDRIVTMCAAAQREAIGGILNRPIEQELKDFDKQDNGGKLEDAFYNFTDAWRKFVDAYKHVKGVYIHKIESQLRYAKREKITDLAKQLGDHAKKLKELKD